MFKLQEIMDPVPLVLMTGFGYDPGPFDRQGPPGRPAGVGHPLQAVPTGSAYRGRGTLHQRAETGGGDVIAVVSPSCRGGGSCRYLGRERQSHARLRLVSRALVSKLDKLEFFLLFVPPPVVAVWLLWIPPDSLMPWRVFAATPGRFSPGMAALACYLVVCWLAAAFVLFARVRRVLSYDVSAVLRFHRSRSLNTRNVLHSPDHPHHALVHLPGNECLKLDLTERGLDVPRLPAGLEGLSIVHISDLHYTGHVGKPFFEEMARMSNALEPDIVAVTGDIADKNDCIAWLPDTLGRLRARYGVYYIFGNHDLRVDWKRMARVLVDCGLIYVGGRWLSIEVRGQPLLLAGNELPWFKPAADPRTFPPRSEVTFRLVLAHSPDQLQWARAGGRRPDAGRAHPRRPDPAAVHRADPFAEHARRGIRLRAVPRSAYHPQRQPRRFR